MLLLIQVMVMLLMIGGVVWGIGKLEDRRERRRSSASLAVSFTIIEAYDQAERRGEAKRQAAENEASAMLGGSPT